MSRVLLLPAVLIGVIVLAADARADLYSDYAPSLEWLVDWSDAIVVAKVLQGGEPGKVELEIALKPAEGAADVGWATDRLASRLENVKTGDRVLVFARKEKGKAADCEYISLTDNASRFPDDNVRREAYFKTLCNYGRPGPACAICTKRGELLTDPKIVVAHVKERIKSPPQLPPSWDGRDPGFRGGLYGVCGCPLEMHDTYFHVMVPADPEFRESALRQLSDEDGWTRERAAKRLEHWNDEEVIAALKKCLSDDFISTLRVNDPPKIAVQKKGYVVRQRAYRSLKKLGISVSEPEIYPE